MGEGGEREREKLKDQGRQTLEKQNFCRSAKHAKLYPDRLKALKKKKQPKKMLYYDLLQALKKKKKKATFRPTPGFTEKLYITIYSWL